MLRQLVMDCWDDEGEGNSVAFDQDGRVRVSGTIGSYQAFWGRRQRGTLDVREFLAGIDAHYAAGKLGVLREEDCPAATLRGVKEQILQERREGDLSAEEAREQWDCAVEGLDGECRPEAVSDWLRSAVELRDEPWELTRGRPTQTFQRFKGMWARMRPELLADIEARPWPEVDPEAYAEEQEGKRAYLEARLAMLAAVFRLQPPDLPAPWPADAPPGRWEDVAWPHWVPARAREALYDKRSTPADKQRANDLSCGAKHHAPGAFVVAVEDATGWRHCEATLCGWYLPHSGRALVVGLDCEVRWCDPGDVEPWSPFVVPRAAGVPNPAMRS